MTSHGTPAEVEAIRAKLADPEEGITGDDVDWLLDALEEAHAAKAAAGVAMHPHYTSTYCIHGLHDDCRLTCKHCPERCRCECHATDACYCGPNGGPHRHTDAALTEGGAGGG